MDRRKFLNTVSVTAAASIAGATTFSAKADALEEAMEEALEPKRRAKSGHCTIGEERERDPNDNRPYYQHNDPALAVMPKAPTLMDFYKLRFSTNHVTQSARLALKNGSSEKVVMACLLHDIGLNIRGTDHGYWCAQLVRPYVDEEVAWAIEKHQALRFLPDHEVGSATSIRKPISGCSATTTCRNPTSWKKPRGRGITNGTCRPARSRSTTSTHSTRTCGSIPKNSRISSAATGSSRRKASALTAARSPTCGER